MEYKVGSKLQLPADVTDPVVLKRFLSALTSNINSNPLTNGDTSGAGEFIINTLEATNSSLNFLTSVANVDELRNNIMAYIAGNLQTNILQNTKNVALIAEQFGTFYAQALAASWYGLSVKAGGAVAGLEIGSLDPDVTTPNDESSYFRVIADNFLVGRAFEDLSQEEKDYLEANNLPAFGTTYNEQGTPIPAILVTWNDVEKLYEIFFNGIVEFNHVRDEVTGDTLKETLGHLMETIATSQEAIEDGIIKAFYSPNAPASGMSYGDWWVDTNSNPMLAYRYEDADGTDVSTMSWVDNTSSIIAEAFISASTSSAVGDGVLNVFFSNTKPLEPDDGDLWVNTTTKATTTRVYDAALDNWDRVSTIKAINSGTTTIDGGMIRTNSLDASRISTGRIVNSSARRDDGTINESAVTMDINLTNGSIWIK